MAWAGTPRFGLACSRPPPRRWSSTADITSTKSCWSCLPSWHSPPAGVTAQTENRLGAPGGRGRGPHARYQGNVPYHLGRCRAGPRTESALESLARRHGAAGEGAPLQAEPLGSRLSRLAWRGGAAVLLDRKSTRLNSS